jgi:hydroxymethylpyrimidine pyrophosphatase-like HAD family hydrolase
LRRTGATSAHYSPLEMQVRVFALDCDGTIESAGRHNSEVHGAIREARALGIGVVLATGRRVDDLKQVIGDLTQFDAVVAENGAVVFFPERERTHGPPEALVCVLRDRGVSVTRGTCVLEADADAAFAVLDEIRRRELPLVIPFNRDWIMVLPQAVSKGTGLRAALDALRLSLHNAVGIGNAENDHSLLEAYEIGVAVS